MAWVFMGFDFIGVGLIGFGGVLCRAEGGGLVLVEVVRSTFSTCEIQCKW